MLDAVKNMPRGANPLYLIQGFSTFSFAILYSSLALYITNQLGLSQKLAGNVVGLFLTFNYALHLIGGLLSGKFLSNRFLFLVTTFVQSIGIALLAVGSTTALYLALSFFLVGCGLNTTSLNCLMTQKFSANDSRRETAFFIFYAMMNGGFFMGYISSGFFDFSNNYQPIFYISLIISTLTAILSLIYWPQLKDKNTELEGLSSRKKLFRCNMGLIAISMLIPLMLISFQFSEFANGLVVLLSVMMAGVIIYLAFKQPKKADKQKIFAYLILAASSLIFWMIYFTGPMGITLFVKNNVDKTLWGHKMATQWIFNINSLVVIIGSPVLALLLNHLRKKGLQVSTSGQFTFALLFLGASFFLLSLGIYKANQAGFVHLFWPIAYIIVQAIAELLIGPVGYAMIGRLAPSNLQGLLMGSWMMVSGVAAVLSHYFSNAMTKSGLTNPLVTNPDYFHTFNKLGITAILGALALYLLSFPIKKLIEGGEKKLDAANEPILEA